MTNEIRLSACRGAAEIGRRNWPRYDQRWRINGTKNHHFLNDWFSRICLRDGHIRLALKLLEQTLAQVTIERQVIDGVVVLVLAGDVNMRFNCGWWVHTDNDPSSLVVMYMMQMNIRVQLGKSHHLHHKETGEPPASRQRPHYSKQLHHSSQIKSSLVNGQAICVTWLQGLGSRGPSRNYLATARAISSRHQAYRAS